MTNSLVLGAQYAGGSRCTSSSLNTCSVYHRGGIVLTEDRKTLFFCYNSKTPRSPQYCEPLFDRARLAEIAGTADGPTTRGHWALMPPGLGHELPQAGEASI
jgi:hypothetical protein